MCLHTPNLQTLSASFTPRGWDTTDPPTPITATAFLRDATSTRYTSAMLPPGVTNVYVSGCFSYGVDLSSADNIVTNDLTTTPDGTSTSIRPSTWPASGTITWQRAGTYSKTTTCSGTRSGNFSDGGRVLDGNCRGNVSLDISCDSAVRVYLTGADVHAAGTFTNTNPVMALTAVTVIAYSGTIANELGRQVLGDMAPGAAVPYNITFTAAPVTGAVSVTVQATRDPGPTGVLLPISTPARCTFDSAGAPLVYTSVPPPTPTTITALPFAAVGADRATPSDTTTVYVDSSVNSFTAGFALTTTSVEPVSATAPGYTPSPVTALTSATSAADVSKTGVSFGSGVSGYAWSVSGDVTKTVACTSATSTYTGTGTVQKSTCSLTPSATVSCTSPFVGGDLNVTISVQNDGDAVRCAVVVITGPGITGSQYTGGGCSGVVVARSVALPNGRTTISPIVATTAVAGAASFSVCVTGSRALTGPGPVLLGGTVTCSGSASAQATYTGVPLPADGAIAARPVVKVGSQAAVVVTPAQPIYVDGAFAVGYQFQNTYSSVATVDNGVGALPGTSAYASNERVTTADFSGGSPKTWSLDGTYTVTGACGPVTGPVTAAGSVNNGACGLSASASMVCPTRFLQSTTTASISVSLTNTAVLPLKDVTVTVKKGTRVVGTATASSVSGTTSVSVTVANSDLTSGTNDFQVSVSGTRDVPVGAILLPSTAATTPCTATTSTSFTAVGTAGVLSVVAKVGQTPATSSASLLAVPLNTQLYGYVWVTNSHPNNAALSNGAFSVTMSPASTVTIAAPGTIPYGVTPAASPYTTTSTFPAAAGSMSVTLTAKYVWQAGCCDTLTATASATFNTSYSTPCSQGYWGNPNGIAIWWTGKGCTSSTSGGCLLCT